MDSLLGSFTKKYINTFSQNDLFNLLKLVEIDDENLYKFNQGQSVSVKIEINNVTKLFASFVFPELRYIVISLTADLYLLFLIRFTEACFLDFLTRLIADLIFGIKC